MFGIDYTFGRDVDILMTGNVYSMPLFKVRARNNSVYWFYYELVLNHEENHTNCLTVIQSGNVI